MTIENGVLIRVEEKDIKDGKLIIPDGVTEIKAGIVWHSVDSSNLEEIVIPKGVTKIGENAFSNFISLKKVVIKNGLKQIGDSAFAGCGKLEEIILPDSVTEIGKSAFTNCSSLKQIRIPKGITKISKDLFDTSGLEQIVIPDTITEIEDGAFRYCKKLKEVTLPKTVTQIGISVFENCENLNKVDIPEGVTQIGERMFNKCTKLKEITIPESVTEIGFAAFEECPFSQIKLPSALIEFKPSTFYRCRNLQEIIIPNNVKIIGFNAFYNCNNLKKVVLPEGLTEIRDSAFEHCFQLDEINFPKSLIRIGSKAFGECISIKEVNLPESLRKIGTEAFYETDIKEITIPKGVTQIGNEAFDYVVKINFEEGIGENIVEKLYLEHGRDNNVNVLPIWGENVFKLRDRFYYIASDEDNKKQFDVFLQRMIACLGEDEVTRMLEIPEFSDEEIKQYELEKDVMFQQFYTTKYRIQGDLKIAFDTFKNLNLTIFNSESNDKNSLEKNFFREFNYIIENEKGIHTVSELIQKSAEKAGIEFSEEVSQRILETESKLNGRLIKKALKVTQQQLEKYLSEGQEIVPRQIKPISIMIQDVIAREFKHSGRLEIAKLQQLLSEKLENANSPYIMQNKDVIVGKAMKYLEDNNVNAKLNHSAFDAIKEVKQGLGAGWKYKLNKALNAIGHSFESLPEEFSLEEIQSLQKKLNIEVQTNSVSVLKDGEERARAYELVLLTSSREIPRIVTYRQIHDMFGSVHEPYSENFRDFFKQNRERFLTDPKCIIEFGRIQSHFNEIVNSLELKNIYEKGQLTIDNILGYLESMEFANQRPGDEELARLVSTYGTASNEKEFEYEQRIFDIVRLREATSIPPINVNQSKYRGRMLSPDDLLNMFVGNITTCCQKTLDVGEGSRLLGSLEDNAGIFAIEEMDSDGKWKMVGQSLVIRQKGANGNLDRLTFDNIEIPNDYKDGMSEEDHALILEIYKKAAKQAMEKDRKFLERKVADGKITRETFDNLVLKEVIAGTGYNDLHGLDDLPKARVIVPDEAYYDYTTMNGNTMHPWIDSAGGKAPTGSSEMPVILARIDDDEFEKSKESKSKLTDVSKWYGRVGEINIYSEKEIDKPQIQIIKQIEEDVYREEQQIFVQEDVEDIETVEYMLDIENAKIAIGSNNDWYLIYGNDEDGDIIISDLAIKGAMNAERNNDARSNPILATAEATKFIYELLLDAGRKNQSIFFNATKDTSLRNVQRVITKGLAKVYDERGNEIIYDKEKGLAYAETNKPLPYRYFSNEENIEMLDLELVPDVDKLEEEIKRTQKLLDFAREKQAMQGRKKNNQIDDLRRQIRKDLSDNNGR